MAGEREQLNTYFFRGFLRYVRCKQPHPRFEQGSPYLFLMTITFFYHELIYRCNITEIKTYFATDNFRTSESYTFYDITIYNETVCLWMTIYTLPHGS